MRLSPRRRVQPLSSPSVGVPRLLHPQLAQPSSWAITRNRIGKYIQRSEKARRMQRKLQGWIITKDKHGMEEHEHSLRG